MRKHGSLNLYLNVINKINTNQYKLVADAFLENLDDYKSVDNMPPYHHQIGIADPCVLQIFALGAHDAQPRKHRARRDILKDGEGAIAKLTDELQLI